MARVGPAADGGSAAALAAAATASCAALPASPVRTHSVRDNLNRNTASGIISTATDRQYVSAANLNDTWITTFPLISLWRRDNSINLRQVSQRWWLKSRAETWHCSVQVHSQCGDQCPHRLGAHWTNLTFEWTQACARLYHLPYGSSRAPNHVASTQQSTSPPSLGIVFYSIAGGRAHLPAPVAYAHTHPPAADARPASMSISAWYT
jgi:hypothetical protein